MLTMTAVLLVHTTTASVERHSKVQQHVRAGLYSGVGTGPLDGVRCGLQSVCTELIMRVSDAAPAEGPGLVAEADAGPYGIKPVLQSATRSLFIQTCSTSPAASRLFCTTCQPSLSTLPPPATQSIGSDM